MLVGGGCRITVQKVGRIVFWTDQGPQQDAQMQIQIEPVGVGV